jgi:hypothetical protein
MQAEEGDAMIYSSDLRRAAGLVTLMLRTLAL